jgi:hypothetical protein
MRWGYVIFALGVLVCLIGAFLMAFGGRALRREPCWHCNGDRNSRNRLNWHLWCNYRGRACKVPETKELTHANFECVCARVRV